MSSNKNAAAQERDFKGIWIPKEIYLSRELSWTEKILLLEIHSLDKDEKGCYASNQYLAEFLGIKSSSLANMISKLKRLGYVEQLWFDGRNRGLRVHFKDIQPSSVNESRVHKKVKQPSQKNENEPSQKCEHNNTYKEESNTESRKRDADASPAAPQTTPQKHSEVSSRNTKSKTSESNKSLESQTDYLARKQTEFPQINITALFKRYCTYCKANSRPPTRPGFDTWCTTEEPPLEIPPEVLSANNSGYVNARTGEGLL